MLRNMLAIPIVPIKPGNVGPILHHSHCSMDVSDNVRHEQGEYRFLLSREARGICGPVT